MLHLVGLSTYWNMMHGTYNVKTILYHSTEMEDLYI